MPAASQGFCSQGCCCGVQRILYNPTPSPSPAKALPEAGQAQTEERAGLGQASKIPEPTLAPRVGQDGDGQPDILDQLMLGGAVQEVLPAKAEDAILTSVAGLEPLEMLLFTLLPECTGGSHQSQQLILCEESGN